MIKSDIIELLEENIGRRLFDINYRHIIFFNLSPRVMEIKPNKWDLVKHSCLSKRNHKNL